MKTLHEPPTADPHGGWCGGWGLDTPGYPLGRSRYAEQAERLSRKVVTHALDSDACVKTTQRGLIDMADFPEPFDRQ